MELRLPMQGNPTCEPIQVIRANNQTHIHTDKYIPWQSQGNLLPLFISVTAVAESRRERGGGLGIGECREMGQEVEREGRRSKWV